MVNPGLPDPKLLMGEGAKTVVLTVVNAYSIFIFAKLTRRGVIRAGALVSQGGVAK